MSSLIALSFVAFSFLLIRICIAWCQPWSPSHNVPGHSFGRNVRELRTFEQMEEVILRIVGRRLS